MLPNPKHYPTKSRWVPSSKFLKSQYLASISVLSRHLIALFLPFVAFFDCFSPL
jgi:hypothetical protein